MELIIGDKSYPIPEKLINIKFFSYNLAKDEVGAEKTLHDRAVVLNSNETMIAKFIVASDIPITGLEKSKQIFGKTCHIKSVL